jgi:hypothetical protein
MDVMRRLLFWSEVGLSEKNAAEERYQRVLEDRDAVVFNELNEKLQRFAAEVHEAFSDIDFGGPGFESEPSPASTTKCYSREGLVLQLGDGLPANTVAKVYAFADPLGLTMYNPQAGFVLGVDDDLGVELTD